MQRDFHYYSIYTLCRLAGIKPEESEIIAYASQHTDDAIYSHELTFESGGRFQQQMSAHKILDLGIFKKEVGYEILMPFHFLPGLEGDDFFEQIRCRQNSKTAKAVIEDTLETLAKPYGLHRLGIALHMYADTWAHQNFSGLRKPHNEVEALKYENRKYSIFEEFGSNIFSELLPPIGHAQAFTCPDEPYLVWSYKPHGYESVIRIDNLNRFMDAVLHIYEFLSQNIREQMPQIFKEDPKSWKTVEGRVRYIFAMRGTLEERVRIWEKKLMEGYFGFRAAVQYDERQWFRRAVTVLDKSAMKFDKNEEFAYSDWKYFHDGLTVHKFFVKNELLPRYGIIT
ncbi:MAG: hypothetical protein K0R93_2382 [Anaerosolibacter sp.]|uniref:DUF6765 family protein n=1 Tax=Anaerosolibacter sp. TaxID=1872527 RepID=UPI00262B8FA8|nr:DUF6765 family protein [Anaerosolibacter sp.]MDF2547484.1 hypothetical protein [Anaerosolibacter sp.]